MAFSLALALRLLAIGALLGVPSPARASEVATTGSEAAQAKAPSAAARAHYSRGLGYYSRREYARALAELQRAHALVPSAKLLFAIGQTHAGLGQYAKSLVALSSYLRIVGSSVPLERRAQVERQLAALRLQTGQLQVTVNRAGAIIRVDGEEVGVSPLPEPVVLDVGPHSVRVSHDGGLPSVSAARVTAGAVTLLHLELPDASPDMAPRLSVPLWIATGALTVLTAGAVIASIDQRNEYERRLERPQSGDPAQVRSSLREQRARLGNWLLATDILAGLTLASGGAALYFSVTPVGGGESGREGLGVLDGLLATAHGTF